MMKRLVDIYPYRITKGGIQLLLMKRSQKVIYSGQWRMIGGKVNKNESRVAASIRELKEETGMYPNKLWVLPSVNNFYDHKSDCIHLIAAFGAQISENKITLNHEHDTFDWFSVSEAIDRLVWPEQQRLIKMMHDLITSDRILSDWLIDLNEYIE